MRLWFDCVLRHQSEQGDGWRVMLFIAMDWKKQREMQSSCLHYIHVQLWAITVLGRLKNTPCLTQQWELCLTPITGLVSYEASGIISYDQQPKGQIWVGGLLNVEVYQSEEGPDRKVWRYRGTICWWRFSVRSTEQWVRGLLPSRLPCLPLSRAFHQPLRQLHDTTIASLL